MVTVALNGASSPGASAPTQASPTARSSPVIWASLDRYTLVGTPFHAMPVPTFFTVPVTVTCGDWSVSVFTDVGPDTPVTMRSGVTVLRVMVIWLPTAVLFVSFDSAFGFHPGFHHPVSVIAPM